MEEKQKNIELQGSGLICDNIDNCDWSDTSIQFEDYGSWVNKPCPKCGENVLTESDFELAKTFRARVDFVNSLSAEELKGISEAFGVNDIALKDNPIFKDVEGIENINPNGWIQVKVHGHNGMKVTEVKNIEK